jgi:broad specificity phosphatase PhoE
VTTTLLLVRHGETDWNRDGRFQGHSDVPLNETGRMQAAALATSLADERIDAVYASDLSRALDTAAPVADAHGLSVEQWPDLREKRFGTWEGLTRQEISERFPDTRPGHSGDGETSEEMTSRVLGALGRIAARHECETVLVVSHGGPLRAVRRHLGAGDDVPIANGEVLRVSAESAGLVRDD